MSRFFAGSCRGRERSLQSAALWQLEMDARDVDRVYGVLEAFGWIDQGFIPEWYERQFDDPTAAERQTRWRAKRDRGRDQFVKQKRTKLSVIQECYSRAAEARRLADTAATPAERADLLAIEQRWLALARNQKSMMRLVVVMCLVLALACAAILFPDEAADFFFWIKEWWGEQS